MKIIIYSILFLALSLCSFAQFDLINVKKYNAYTSCFDGRINDNDYLGQSISPIGDLNDDGNPDFVVSAHVHDAFGQLDGFSGGVFILFMDENQDIISMQPINEVEGGFDAEIIEWSLFGFSVEGIGDIDQDGVEDIAIGAPKDDIEDNYWYEEGTGTIWITFLNTDGTVKAYQKLRSCQPAFMNDSLIDNSRMGECIENLGDRDGDGVNDIAVGTIGGCNPHLEDTVYSGGFHILYLNTDGTVKENKRYDYIAEEEGEYFGASIADMGDLNGDGFNDLAVGAYGNNNNPDDSNYGAIYVLFMNENDSVIQYNVIDSNTPGMEDLNENDWLGYNIANIGDINGDCINDLAAGVYKSDLSGSNQGGLFIMTLNSEGNPETVQLYNGNNELLSPTMKDDDRFGRGLCNAGDLDGNGSVDLFVGASWDDDFEQNAGAFYCMYFDGASSCQQNIKPNKDEKILFYPNPTNSILNFTNYESISKIKIYNQLGELILSKNIKDDYINVSSLKNGLYILEIGHSNGQFSKSKFLKR